jgi:hypothetical protein
MADMNQCQKILESKKPGATIIPVIISSDKTQVTLFRNKSAYPVYLTIGNIPKGTRRKSSQHSYILLGYIPTTRLEHVTNKAARRRMLINLYHACLSRFLNPLKPIGRKGIAMMSGDGALRRTHPLFAIFSGDYPEQVLATCVTSGECVPCPTKRDELDKEPTESYRDMDQILDAFEFADDPDLTEFILACKLAGIKPIVHPFWRGLPLVHIFRSICPDILHQFYQGVIKHLTAWIKSAFGPLELDARCRRLPPNHNIHLFMKGITTLSRISGQEHAQICRILLGLIVDLRLPGNQSPIRLVRAVRAMLDALYLAQYPMHSDDTLALLENALSRFDESKQIFIDLGIRSNFNITKFHFVRRHYIDAIKYFGTTDNYNTEYTERLHIDLVKDAYRATNRKDELSQMTLWLERKEKVFRHDSFIAWRLSGSPSPSHWEPPVLLPRRQIQITKHPSRKRVTLRELETSYGASSIQDALTEHFVRLLNAGVQMTRNQFEVAMESFDLPFQSVAVYHKLKFWNRDSQGFSGRTETLDAIHIRPEWTNKKGNQVPGRFDTALFKEATQGFGVKGMPFYQLTMLYS